MKSTSLIKLTAVLYTTLVSFGHLQAQDVFRYRLSGDWSTVTDGTSEGWGLNPNNNGSPGAGLPGDGQQARINWGGNEVTVTSEVPTVGRVMIGVDESGTVRVQNGGVLSSSGDVLAGNNNFDAFGTLIVEDGGVVDVANILWTANNDSNGAIVIESGGTVNVGSHLWWGASMGASTATASTIDISGTLNQTGGILGLGWKGGAADAATGGKALVTILDGGELNLNNIFGADNRSIQDGSSINIEGSGRLTLRGDLVGAMRRYRDAGLILGNGLATIVDDPVLPDLITVDVSLDSTSPSGDFNSDGEVDLADYTLWRNNVGDPNGLPNDDGLGTVGTQHYDLWRSNIGATGDPITLLTAVEVPQVGGVVAAVPEPGTLGLVGLMGALAITVARLRRVY